MHTTQDMTQDFEKIALEFDALDAKLEATRQALAELEARKLELLSQYGITAIGSPIYKAWGEFNKKRRGMK